LASDAALRHSLQREAGGIGKALHDGTIERAAAAEREIANDRGQLSLDSAGRHLADAVENVLSGQLVAALRLETLKFLVEGRDIPGQPMVEEGALEPELVAVDCLGSDGLIGG